ncbi:hypothetical protein NC652_041241 [Populus alba x Populus x berolinensis]|nr:hypothetical protein NC652_041241 [Populus alba x Populus x berolinensis]
MDGDFYLSCFVGAGLPGTQTRGISATFKGFYLGPRNEAVSILNQVFPELGIGTEDCKEMTWIESILFFSGLSDGSIVSDLKNRYTKERNYFKAKSDYVRRNISFEGIRTALDILEKEPRGEGGKQTYLGEQLLGAKRMATETGGWRPCDDPPLLLSRFSDWDPHSPAIAVLSAMVSLILLLKIGL